MIRPRLLSITTDSRTIYIGGGASAVVAVLIAAWVAVMGGGTTGTLGCFGAGAECYTPATCTTTISGGLTSAVSTAIPGAVICLAAAGSPYPELTTSATKAGDVTIQAVPGEAVTIDYIEANAASHLTFQDMTATQGVFSRGSTHVHYKFMTMLAASQLCTSNPCNTGVVPDADVSLEHDVFDNIQNGISEGRVEVEGYDSASSTAGGLTISYSHFGGTALNGGSGGCSDGIGLHAAASHVLILHNEFDHLYQGACASINGAHVDPIESFVADSPSVIGNYFHDNSDGSGGLGWFSGASGTATITNNVFDCTGLYPYPASIPGTPGADFRHNVIAGPSCQLELGKDNQCEDSTGALVRDNVWDNGGGGGVHFGNLNGCVPGPDGIFTRDHNLNCVCGETVGGLTGTPVFVGGSTPTTWQDWALDSSSPGYLAASDGTSMGIVP